MKQQHKQMIKWSWFNADKKEVETAEATEEGKEEQEMWKKNWLLTKHSIIVIKSKSSFLFFTIYELALAATR